MGNISIIFISTMEMRQKFWDYMTRTKRKVSKLKMR
jgi:hypothetical protein